MKCENCGEDKEDVYLKNDPMSEALDDEVIQVCMCEACYDELLFDF